MTLEQVAQAAHEINRAYCISRGDFSQVQWEHAPEWQKSSAIHGVEFHLSHPTASPSLSHEMWMKEKLENGWVYGEEKDSVKKTHPSMVSYTQLPIEERTKDHLFKQVVASLKQFIH
jgi:hypothetical protein